MNAQAASTGGTSVASAKHGVVTIQQRKARARLEYQRGVNLYATGDLLESLAAFERAYEAIPHYTVLFNIGQIRGKLGRSVEANHALRQFLEQGAYRIDENLRRQAQQAIQMNEQRMGRIQVVIDPSDARLLVDGSPRDPAATDIQLDLGPHVLVVTRDGYLPRTEVVEVLGGSMQTLQMRLEPLAIQPKTNSWLRARCSVPGVAVVIDDRPAVRLDRSAHFQVESGARRVRFERSGYATTSFEVLVRDASVATADCGLKRLRNTSNVHLAALSVSAPRGWLAFVDGERFEGEPLPAGPHHVEILRGGQVVWAQDVTLVVGETHRISPPLLPLREGSQLRVSHSTQTVAYIAGGIGLAAIVGGGLALGLGAHRYSRWEKERDELATGQSTDWAGAVTHAAEIQRLDGLGVGLGVAGIGLVAAAAYLLLSPGHKDTRTTQIPSRSAANAVLSGTF